MPNNVVEVVVKTVDEASAPLRNIVGAIEEVGSAIEAGIGGAVTVAAFRKFIDNTEEAETAQVRLQLAVKNTIEGAFQSAKQLQDFSEQFGKTSIFSAADLDNAQATLSRFDRVYGDTFDRARKDALDLAAAVGGNVVSAANALGRALESPTLGLRTLAEFGVTFSTAQRALVTELDRTGQSLKAQGIILAAVESQTQGASDAVGNTLSGAFSRLGNSITDVFRSDSLRVVADVINAVADAINAANKAAKTAGESGGVGDFFSTVASAGVRGAAGPFGAAVEGINKVTSDVFGRNILGVPNGAASSKAPAANAADPNAFYKSYDAIAKIQIQLEDDYYQALLKSLTEFTPSLLLSGSDKNKEFDQKLSDAVATAAEKIADQYAKQIAQVDIASQHGQISPSDALKKRQELLDQVLPEFATPGSINYNAQLPANQRSPLTSLSTDLHKDVTPAQHPELEDLEGAIDRSKQGLESLLNQGGVTGRSITQTLVKAFEAQEIYSALNAIGNALKKSLEGAVSGSSSTGGFLASIFGAFIGGHAGGGMTSGASWVGEDGPELLVGSGRIYNQRQLAFAGAGGGQTVHYAPSTVINVQGNADQKTIAYVEGRLAQTQKDQRQWLSQTMKNNGYKPLRG